MFERIFKYHYSNKFAYALDATLHLDCIRGHSFPQWICFDYSVSIRQTCVYSLALGCVTLFRGYKMVLRFTTFIDIGKITSGLILTIVLYAIYIQGRYSRALQLFIVIILFQSYPFCPFID